MISAQDVASTLIYVAPGFLFLKAFYLYGIRAKRSDLEWTLMSLAAAVPINAGVAAFDPNPGDVARHTLILMGAGIAGGLILGVGWSWLAPHLPAAPPSVRPMAWDMLITRAQKEGLTVQATLTSGQVIRGWVELVSDSLEAETLDIYLRDPLWVDPISGAQTRPAEVNGVWLAVSSISLLETYGARSDPAPAA